MPYIALKHLHVAFAVLSLLTYVLRGIWTFRGSPLAASRWMRILPHVVYTAVILLGATLATITGQWGMSWVWLKLVLLVAFVAVGAIALSPRNSWPRARRISLWGMGLVLFLMIFAVAAHHHALMAAGVPPPADAAAPDVPAGR